MKVFLTSHPSGLLMLPPPDDLAAADEDVDVDDLETTVSALAEESPFVVIDARRASTPLLWLPCSWPPTCFS